MLRSDWALPHTPAGALLSVRDYGGALAMWLNSDFEWQKHARGEVADTIREMKEGIATLRKYHERWVRTPNENAEQHFFAAALDIYTPRIFTRVEPRINPAVDPRRFGEWDVKWRYSRVDGPVPISHVVQEALFGMDESDAIRCLVQLAEEGLLERMRECPKCGKWLYATFRHQRFCSTKCQQTHYKSSEEWKSHRRVWMRNYRRHLVTKNALTRSDRQPRKDWEQRSGGARARMQR
jgi:ribosomal protein S27AE